MTARHTPGPWHLRADDTGADLYAGNPHFGKKTPIARIHWDGARTGVRGEDVGNCNLIVAAPDLLLAAQAALEVISSQRWPSTAAMLFDAIAKATGERK